MMNLKAAAIATGLLLLSCFQASAQTSPNLTYGQVLTPAQWNQLFINKEDTLGFTPINSAGGIMTGRLVTAPSGATTAGFNFGCGSTPSAPVNGDTWCTTAGLFVQINGATIGPLAQTGGTNVFTGQQTTQGLTTTSPGWYTQITGDTNARVRVGLNSIDVPSLAFGLGSAVRDTFIERAGAANIRHGSPDAAAPVAQIISVQNVVAGTSNTAGVALTIDGSQGTGTGAGGDIFLKVATAGSTGSTQNAFINGLHIYGADAGIATGAATDPGTGNLNLAGGALWNNGTAPTGTGAYMRGTGPTMSGPTITGTIAGSPTITSPTINGGALSGTFSGTFTVSGAPSFTGLAAGTCSNSVLINSSGLVITGSCPGAASSIQDATTTIISGVSSTLLYNNAGVLGHITTGSVGQHLGVTGTTPTYKSGGWELLASVTANNTSGTLTDGGSAITTAYNSYEIEFSNILCATSTQTLQLQISIGGTPQTSGYISQVLSGNTSTAVSQGLTTGVPLGFTSGCPTSGAGISGTLRVYQPAASGGNGKMFQGTFGSYSGSTSVGGQMNGYVSSAGAISGVQINVTSGNLVSGSLRVKGSL